MLLKCRIAIRNHFVKQSRNTARKQLNSLFSSDFYRNLRWVYKIEAFHLAAKEGQLFNAVRLAMKIDTANPGNDT